MERGGNKRLVLKPTAVPSAIGSRIEPGRLVKTESGMVTDGMYVVILDADWWWSVYTERGFGDKSVFWILKSYTLREREGC